MESSIKQTEDEGVEAHGQHGLVEGEEEGGDGVAETTEEEEEVGLGTRQSEPSHCSRYIRGQIIWLTTFYKMQNFPWIIYLPVRQKA